MFAAVKSDDEIRALDTDLALAIQMRALAHFYVTAVHDLKAPLNAMVVTVELLADALRSEGDADPEVAARRGRYLEVLRREIARLNDSVQSLLTQTPPASETSRVFDLRQLLEEILELLAPQTVRRRVTLELHPGEPLPVVGRRNHMKQALLNIAINALETVTDGGRVEVAGAIVNGQVTISMRHDGPPISDEICTGIYQPHVATQSGHALTGLYVARTIIEAHGGQIRLDIESDHDACVRANLPLAVSGDEGVEC